MAGVLTRRHFRIHTCAEGQRSENTEVAIYSHGEALEETHFVGYLILDFQSPQQRDKKFLLLKLPGLWYFVVAALAD